MKRKDAKPFAKYSWMRPLTRSQRLNVKRKWMAERMVEPRYGFNRYSQRDHVALVSGMTLQFLPYIVRNPTMKPLIKKGGKP